MKEKKAKNRQIENSEIFVFKPELTPYEGLKITKDTKLKYENSRVIQTIENLKLVSKYTLKTDKYTSVNILELNLDEGEILLFEGENRGWFLPKDIGVCTIDEAIEQYEVLKEALGEKKED